MKRIFVLLLIAGSVYLAACDNESSLPQATGKASVRAINAISTSQDINVLIEERTIGTAAYTLSTPSSRYDDLDYTFNVEAFYASDRAFRRVASQFIDFEASKDYTLLVSGSLQNADITVWEGDERSFDEADTVFEARFAHASDSIGTVDYYFADAAVAPTLGDQVATLSFGEISAPIDYEANEYVLTITAAGDPDTVMYRSETTTFASRSALIVTSFDSDATNAAPVVVRAISTLGGIVSMPDAGIPPTTEFVNASMDLGTTDIYDDELLTSQRVTNHAYLDQSAEIDIAADDNTFYYTPAGDTSAVLLEGSLPAFSGTRYRLVAVGTAGELGTTIVVPDRQPAETHAKLLIFNASNNYDFVDIYTVEPDTSVDDSLPVRVAVPTRQAATTVQLASGSYDLYVTELQEKVVLAGPYRIDVDIGDIVDSIIVDTVDPAVLDVLFLSGGPL